MDKQKAIRCIDCRKRRLMQWENDPIISECKWSGRRLVADSKRFCIHFELTRCPPIIEHFKTYTDG